MDERTEAELVALRAEDAALDAETTRVRHVEAVIALVRGQVEGIRAQLAAYGTQSARLQEAVREADRVVRQRAAVLEAAERELETQHDDETWARLERALLRAKERAEAAGARRERAVAALEQLEGDTAELPAEVRRLEAEARSITAANAGLPAPASGVDGLVEWASHAHAELFVTLSQLDRRREQVIREANELASMLLGEPTYGSTVAQAAARVEHLR